jgi:hypothetical protein
MSKSARPIAEFNDKLGFVPLHKLDWAVALVSVGFVLVCIGHALRTYNTLTAYLILDTIHHYFAYFALAIAVGMFGIALYIGLAKHADVTAYFRRGAYVVLGMMLFQGLLGAMMYFGMSIRPADEVHLIYGAGTILALPFFIFVETTAEKRPAMGSYMWGFALLAGIIIRCIGTGSL